MNNVILTGNIVRDSELRFSQSGKGVYLQCINEGFGITQYLICFNAEKRANTSKGGVNAIKVVQ